MGVPSGNSAVASTTPNKSNAVCATNTRVCSSSIVAEFYQHLTVSFADVGQIASQLLKLLGLFLHFSVRIMGELHQGFRFPALEAGRLRNAAL